MPAVSSLGETETVVEDGESRGIVVCSICQAEFSYHLNAKHPTESSPRLDGRQTTLHDFSRKITRPVREKVTNAVAVWVAGDCRPINIVENGGLTEVFRIASGDNVVCENTTRNRRAASIQPFTETHSN